MKSIICILVILVLFSNASCTKKNKYAVIVSANMEWKALKKVYPPENFKNSPWGEYFFKKVQGQDILFFHEGWGKVSAAGATQYVIDKFNPEILINIGTCGGFEGEIERFDIILADKTIIYDIVEAMGDSKEAIADYTTKIDLSWLGENFPSEVHRTLLVSADKDLRIDEIATLKQEYSAVAGDWETGAIAYVAAKNKKKILILRGVTDLVSDKRGEAYDNFNLFVQRTDTVMAKLLSELPGWINYIENCR
jgi:adenosylhomocysteine nucleosidase